MIRSYSRVESRNANEKTIFNYRLSRARRTTENSFGLLSQIFRVFYTPIPLKTETVDYLVLAGLHNLLYDRYLENTDVHFYSFDANEPPISRNTIALLEMNLTIFLIVQKELLIGKTSKFNKWILFNLYLFYYYVLLLLFNVVPNINIIIIYVIIFIIINIIIIIIFYVIHIIIMVLTILLQLISYFCPNIFPHS